MSKKIDSLKKKIAAESKKLKVAEKTEKTAVAAADKLDDKLSKAHGKTSAIEDKIADLKRALQDAQNTEDARGSAAAAE